MKYKNYSNGGNFLILGILLLLFFGGFRILFVSLALFFSAFFKLLPLILIGLFIYFILKNTMRNAKIHNRIRLNTFENKRFIELLTAVLALAIQADGKVDQRELDIVYHFFRANLGYDELKMNWVKDLMQSYLKRPVALGVLCEEIVTLFQGQATVVLLQLVYRILTSDDVLTNSEKTFVDSLVNGLKISATDHEKIRALFTTETEATNYYAILGLQDNASLDEIKKAYREAAKENHPDKVHHLGEEFRSVAEEKMIKINEAYQHLIKKNS